MKCTEKISEGKRLNIFNDFWGIGDFARQRYFVASCMGVVKLKYFLHKENSKRSMNVSYNLTINTEVIRDVCKRFFTATLDICHSFLSTVNKKKAGASGVIIEDRRGRHGNTGRWLAQADKDGAREHINSYRRKESYYCRASSTKKHLDGDINMILMYRQYKNSAIRIVSLLSSKEPMNTIFETSLILHFKSLRRISVQRFSCSESTTDTAAPIVGIHRIIPIRSTLPPCLQLG